MSSLSISTSPKVTSLIDKIAVDLLQSIKDDLQKLAQEIEAEVRKSIVLPPKSIEQAVTEAFSGLGHQDTMALAARIGFVTNTAVLGSMTPQAAPPVSLPAAPAEEPVRPTTPRLSVVPERKKTVTGEDEGLKRATSDFAKLEAIWSDVKAGHSWSDIRSAHQANKSTLHAMLKVRDHLGDQAQSMTWGEARSYRSAALSGDTLDHVDEEGDEQ